MLEQTDRKRLFSGIQPTGELHLGNYIGALTLWAEQQHQYASIFCIVDLHAITIPEAITPEYLRMKTREAAAILIAAGIDPDESVIFIQSHVRAHTELTWVLNCVTPLGWLERMTQFKAKSALAESIGTGLLDYPVLQAADVLLYKTNVVPVGEDQRQHIELMTDIAQRFNHLYGEVFVLPEAMIRSSGARVMGLDDPSVKMSKSLGEKRKGHAIGIVEPPEAIRQAVMRAVTDSGKETHFESASPGVKNLLVIYEVLSGETRPRIEARFEGKGYGALKRDVADVVIAALEPVRARYTQLMAQPDHLEDILRRGADRVRPAAEATLQRVRELVGLG